MTIDEDYEKAKVIIKNMFPEGKVSISGGGLVTLTVGSSTFEWNGEELKKLEDIINESS